VSVTFLSVVVINGVPGVCGIFVPLHFRSRERKVHRENFRCRGTLVPWNIRTRGTFAPQTTFVLFNFRSCGTFAPVLKKSCGKQESNVSIGVFWQTFAAVYLSGNEFKRCHVGLYNNGLTIHPSMCLLAENHRLELNGMIK